MDGSNSGGPGSAAQPSAVQHCGSMTECGRTVAQTFPRRCETRVVAVNANTKKYVTWIIVAFVLFFVLGQPTQAAQIVHGALALLQQAAEAAITFMKTLFVR